MTRSGLVLCISRNVPVPLGLLHIGEKPSESVTWRAVSGLAASRGHDVSLSALSQP
jgi:hypothetical protein